MGLEVQGQVDPEAQKAVVVVLLGRCPSVVEEERRQARHQGAGEWGRCPGRPQPRDHWILACTRRERQGAEGVAACRPEHSLVVAAHCGKEE